MVCQSSSAISSPARPCGDLLGKGRLGPWAAANLIVKVAEALAYAHSMGAVHRDIKPATTSCSTPAVRSSWSGSSRGKLGLVR